MTKEEIFDKDDSLRNINHMTKVIFSKTADVHLWYMMKECAEDTGMWFDFGNYDMILMTAFYFKYYNIYKTSDSLSKTYIDTVINKSNTDETVMKLYSRHFIKWLNEQLEQQMRKLYTVIQYNFYKRFYEWSDINHYGVGLADRISEGFIEQLNEKYGDRKIPLLNKEIDY